MSCHLPCSFADYQGTRWHRRLISGEFTLQFDQYPTREVIIDSIAELQVSNPAQKQAWKDRIRTICTVDDETWNKLSPGQLVELLRAERTKFIPVTTLSWRSSSFQLRQPEEIFSLLKTSTIFIFPDIHDACPLAQQISLVSSYWKTQPNRIVCIPEKHKKLAETIPACTVRLMPNPTELTEEQLQTIKKEGTILCCDVWYALAFLNAGVSVLSYLDKREWFASVVLKENRYEEKGYVLPKQTCYGSLFSQMENNRPLRTFQMLNGPSGSGVYAELEGALTTPVWVEQAVVEKSLKIMRGFFIKEGETWGETQKPSSKAIQVAFSFFAKDRVSLTPVFFAGKHSPLSLSYPKGGFFTSFNYYFTENLKNWYAQQDARILPWDDFLLDYLAFPHEGGLYESVPLYHKALLGYGKDGSLFACKGEWDTITLVLDEKMVFVFDNKGPKETEIHFPSDATQVGEGRWCLTFIHDYLWDACKGPVQVPPFGVVVTTEERIEHVQKVQWSVAWKDLPIPKDEIAWMAGGFNLLVHDKKNLVGTKEEAYAQLENEGWFTPSSLATQETELNVMEKQPRSMIGFGGGQCMVMSVSGRNPKSKGITFSEATSLALQVFKETNGTALEFLLNLDGGASSVLGCKKDGEASCLFTKPSPSITNPAGCPRSVPSLLTIQLK